MSLSRMLKMSALAVLALGVTGLVGTATGRALQGRPIAAAVVNVQQIFESLKEKTEVEGDLKREVEALNEQEQERRKEIQALQSDLEILAPGTPAFSEKQAQLEQKSIELQAWRGFQNQKLNRERGIQIEVLYRRMVDAIGRVAESGGYDLVLFKEAAVNFRGAKPEALNALIQVRKVLWASDDLDITDDVIQLMNNEFNNMAQ